MWRGLWRPLRGSGYALGQPDAFGAGAFQRRFAPTPESENGQLAFRRTFSQVGSVRTLEDYAGDARMPEA